MPMEFSREVMRRAKEEARDRCIDVAMAETPAAIRYVVPRRSLTGRAYEDHIEAPRPFTRKALYVYLHEVAHVALGHFHGRRPRHLEEYEAEQWAHKRMRAHGIPVPCAMTQRAKRYVAWKIDQAKRRGAKKIDPGARRFSGVAARGWRTGGRNNDAAQGEVC